MSESTRWDAVVVGAGPAGTVVAAELVERGHRVLLVDAGPRLRPGERTPEVDRRAWAYGVVGGAFDWYRVRAVGGRALLWGGWSHRFGDAVFKRNGWPYRASTLAPWYARAERRLALARGTVDPRHRRVAQALGITIVPKHTAMWTPLSERVVRGARTYSVALRLVGSGVEILDLLRERTEVVRARAIVLAASPVETTRILLRSGYANVGRNLVDHMVASYLLLEPTPPTRPVSALATGLVNTHAGNRRRYDGGFSIEISGPSLPRAFGVERMIPPGEEDRWSATQIHALGEMTPHRRRYVDLDPESIDVLGRPIPRIHVAWSAAEKRMAEDMRRASVGIADALATPGSKLVPFVDPLQPGAGHEAGTCAMGADEGAPCNAWGRLRGAENVWIADASALPTAGDRHPTLTLIAHALRTAHDVLRAFRRTSSKR